VFSAFPGVRTKGTKNKVGLLEAFEDRSNKGWAWNNLMLQKWVDHEGVEHKVLDDYLRNKQLCDLTAQPEDIQQIIKTAIDTETSKEKNVAQVGVRMLKFCASYDLNKISDNIHQYVDPFNARYSKT
jgi:hypothetical protein